MEQKFKIADLYCGGGGAAMGYARAGLEVVGFDINKQPHYPFEFVQADVLELGPEYLRQFDAVHASPPCQFYTGKTPTWGRKRVHWEDHPQLIEPTREMLKAAEVDYVLENVKGAPVRNDIMLCGTMFGLRIIKHRYFECSFPVFDLMPQCDHGDVYNPWAGKGRTADKLREAQGTPWLPMHGGASRKAGYTGDLNNAIPPAYTEWLGRKLIAHLRERRAAA
jgi:DNA (cytosine-5)-methyltransferase 1